MWHLVFLLFILWHFDNKVHNCLPSTWNTANWILLFLSQNLMVNVITSLPSTFDSYACLPIRVWQQIEYFPSVNINFDSEWGAAPWTYCRFEVVPLVGFMDLVFTCIPVKRCRRWLRSMLRLCDICWVLIIKPLVCWFFMLLFQLFRGSYPPVPPQYSYDLRGLIAQLFKRAPR